MEYGVVATWWLLYVVLWVAGLPVAAIVFEAVPRRGAGVALPVVLGLLGLSVFWLGHLAPLSLALPLGIGCVALVVLLARRRDPEIDRAAVGGTLLVFTVAFLFVVALRAIDPAVNATNGEKFLDYGLLRTLSRTTRLPPEDMWFAGEPVRYYYGGHLLVALLGKLSGTAPPFAYNVGLAGYYAMLVTAVYEVAAAVAAARSESPRLAGLAAAFFVGAASNLLPAARFSASHLPPADRRTAARVLAEATDTLTPERVTGGFEPFSFWSASRVVPGTITEFPLFSWLFGDLHAHMMSAPFLVVGAAVCHAYYRTPGPALARRRGLVVVALPLVGGFLTVVSTWGAPTLLGLVGLTLLFAPADPAELLPGASSGRASPTRRAVGAALCSAAVASLVVLVSAPFVATLAGADAAGRSIALLAPDARSGPVPLLLVHGAFLAVFAVTLLADLVGARPGRRLVAAAAVLLGCSALAAAVRTPAFALFGPLLLGGAWRLRAGGRGDFESLLVVAGAGLALIVEWAYVVDQATSGRVNTVFKAYMQLWVLWSVAAGVALPSLWHSGGASGETTTRGRRSSSGWRSSWRRLTSWRRPARRWLPSWRRVAGASMALLVVLSTGLYGVVAVDRHLAGTANRSDDLRDTAPAGDAPPTLDATRFVDRRHPGEAPAIAWLADRPGTPRIATAPGRAFTNWTSAPSTLTGVPTVAGWTHERLYHGEERYYGRVATVDTIYCGPPGAQAWALDATNVSYVYLGESERERYEVRPLARLDGVSVANRSRNATVYRVDQRRLSAGERPRDGRCAYEVTGLETENGTGARGRVFENSSGESNFSWRGPFTMLPPGTYRVTFRVDASGSTQRPVAHVAVSTNENRGPVASRAVFVDPEPQSITLNVTLTEGRTAVEFRGFKPHDEGRIELVDVSVSRRLRPDRPWNRTPDRRPRPVS